MYPIPRNKKVEKSLKNANEYWDSLLIQIAKSGHDPRITILLANIMIEYYMNEILIVGKKLKSHKQKMKYEEKINLLSKEPKITSRLIQNIKQFYKLRNAYAHQMNVDWNWVNNIIDSMCKQFPHVQFPESPKQKYNKVLPMVVRELARNYADRLAMIEQAHYDKILNMRKFAKKKSPINTSH